MAILIIVSLMPQSVFSMVPQQSTQLQDIAEFEYFEAHGNLFRKVKNTGQFQRRVGMQWELPDGTRSNDYKWVESDEPSAAINLETTSKEENNDFE